MNVLLDTSPLQNANSIRGVGVYTRFLEQYLRKSESSQFHFFDSESRPNGTKIDIIHYPFFDLFFRTLHTKRNSDQKIVVTIHDVIPLLFSDNYPVGVRGKVNVWLQKKSLKNTDAVVTDSFSSKKDIHKYLKIPLHKIHVIYLAGNPQISQRSQQKISTVKKNYNLPERYLLYVGDINYNKNVVSLIEALTLVDESIHLVCVGKNFTYQPIPEWARISETISKYNLTNRIKLISQLGQDATADLSAIYSGALAYTQPSLYEGFGLPVLEALKCLTPVIAADNSSLKEIGGDVVVFSGTSAKELAKHISILVSKDLRSDEKWREKVSKHLQQFSWTKTAKQTFNLYQQLLTKK